MKALERIKSRLEVVQMTVGTLREEADGELSYEKYHATVAEITKELSDIGRLYGKPPRNRKPSTKHPEHKKQAIGS